MANRDSDTHDDHPRRSPHDEKASGFQSDTKEESARPWFKVFSPMEREERLELLDRIESGATTGVDYVVLMLNVHLPGLTGAVAGFHSRRDRGDAGGATDGTTLGSRPRARPGERIAHA